MSFDDGITKDVISTGHLEIDRKLGGGIPLGSLSLIEGESDSGKSVFTQQVTWGCVNNDYKVLIFTTESTVRSLIKQMESLGLGILDHLLLGNIKIYTMKPSQIKLDPQKTFDTILRTVSKSMIYNLVIVDSLTPMMANSSEGAILSYIEECKMLCDKGYSIMNTIHTYAVNQDIMIRTRSACDAHLRFMIEKVGDKLVKSLEVAKIRGAAQSTGNIMTFEVEPEVGMKIMPMSRAKA